MTTVLDLFKRAVLFPIGFIASASITKDLSLFMTSSTIFSIDSSVSFETPSPGPMTTLSHLLRISRMVGTSSEVKISEFKSFTIKFGENEAIACQQRFGVAIKTRSAPVRNAAKPESAGAPV